MQIGTADQTNVAFMVLVITEIVKTSVFTETPRWIPSFSLGLGILLGLLAGLTLFESIIAGAAASGLYDVAKKTIMNK